MVLMHFTFALSVIKILCNYKESLPQGCDPPMNGLTLFCWCLFCLFLNLTVIFFHFQKLGLTDLQDLDQEWDLGG